MPVQITPETPLKAAVSVSFQCRLLRISRSQFYWHVKRGTFHPPLYLASNKRPYFTASMVEDNLRARETGVAVNGDFVIFYERQPTSTMAEAKKPKVNHTAMLEKLHASNLKGVTSEQVEAALAATYPNGTCGLDEDSVFRAVLKYLKRSGAG